MVLDADVNLVDHEAVQIETVATWCLEWPATLLRMGSRHDITCRCDYQTCLILAEPSRRHVPIVGVTLQGYWSIVSHIVYWVLRFELFAGHFNPVHASLLLWWSLVTTCWHLFPKQASLAMDVFLVTSLPNNVLYFWRAAPDSGILRLDRKGWLTCSVLTPCLVDLQHCCQWWWATSTEYRRPISSWRSH